MKILIKLISLIILMPMFSTAQEKVPVYQNLELSFEERAQDLVSRMTLEEKISQLLHDAKAVDRLGIPAYNWMNECLHGVANMEGYATVFPQAIGMAASFDSELMFKVASAISDEARAMHHNGIRNAEEGYVCGLTFWSPNINLDRDPRWGRGQETYGEDPYLTGRMAVSFIKGLQGNDPKYLKTVSTVKHFVVHSGPEAKRHEFNTLSNERDFWESYMPHFIAGIQEANVQSVMCAYSRLNGESCCGSSHLLNDILRKKLGFKGYVVSDCGSVADIYDGHHLVDSIVKAAVLALKSGVDLNCGRAMSFPYEKLAEAVRSGLINESYINKAVYRLMLARFKLGMFDPPEMVPYTKISVEVIDSPEHKELALQMARESIVLLKNENQTLPLKKDIKKIAVIGPNADNNRVLYGNYNGIPSNPVSVLKGIKEKLPDAEVFYSRGAELVKSENFFSPVPLKFLFTPDKKNGLLASYFPNRNFAGKPLHTRIENKIMIFDEFGAPFKDLQIDNFSVRWEGLISFPESANYKIKANSSPHYKIFINDKFVADEKSGGKFIKFEAHKFYKIRIDFVSDSDGFYFVLIHSADNKSLLKNSLAIAKKSDAVILSLGISSLIEEESLDRKQIELPDVQQTLLKEILKLGKPTILVLMGGSAISLDKESLKVPAIIDAWYPGQSGGVAVADALFGDYNPAARLPVTFYKSTSQLPPYEDYSMENRTYKFFKGEPLFPFGFGLSYTTFKYSNLNMPEFINSGESIELEVEVQNCGNVAGDEVVEVYVKDVKTSVRVPLHSLQGFKRIHLNPGEKQIVNFKITPKQLALLDNDMNWVVEPGEFIISVGGGQPGVNQASTESISKSINVTGEKYLVNYFVNNE
ncbi:glycoside hydrolase family 3 C-terminal domain-containing protein [bacterium]|nr:glycoside hydrolase family 3 C-terminal domain-containing protein [bacterium]